MFATLKRWWQGNGERATRAPLADTIPYYMLPGTVLVEDSLGLKEVWHEGKLVWQRSCRCG